MTEASRTPLPPTTEDLRSYCRGALRPDRFAAIERWLDGQPAGKVERLLSEAAGDADAGLLTGLSGSGAVSGFVAEFARNRLWQEREIGVGGMATVAAARDRALERVVALKVLRPRQPGEALEQFHLRDECFRREAAITASLEHPGVVPVYDVGRVDGLPAFTMKRLDGKTLDVVIAERQFSLTELVACMLRVADTVAYAHSRGIVHRDLTPSNILIADFGAVYVLDWGLAANRGETSGTRSGTPAWMAPEQATGAPADPRLDVFALGALLRFVITGRPPSESSGKAPADDARGLDARGIPLGLAAVARRCLDVDPAARYGDASAVAAELRRWLQEGITFAQSAGPLQQALQRLRRSPQTKDAVLIGLLAVACMALSIWAMVGHDNEYDAQRIASLAKTVQLDRPAEVRVALEEVRQIRGRRPHMAAADQLALRLEAVVDVEDRHVANERLSQQIEGLLARTRIYGQWPDESTEWRGVLHQAGLSLSAPASMADRARLRDHPLRQALVEVVAYLWRAEMAHGDVAAASAAAALITESGPTLGWQALGRLLTHTLFVDREPVFCPCVDSDQALRESDCAAFMLSVYSPDKRLVAYSRSDLVAHPGAFWSLISSARAHLMAGEVHDAQHAAMVASGAEPESIFPQLILAYVALRQNDQPELEDAVRRGLAVSPDHEELLVLQAVSLARSGHSDEARRIVTHLDPGRIRYHLEHPFSQPMGISVAALAALGLVAPVVDARPAPEGASGR